MDITPETKIKELLDTHPDLLKSLIEFSSAFEKLENPILRKTIAKVTTIKQAATIANVSLGEMINKLRSDAGLGVVSLDEEENAKNEIPEWIEKENIDLIYDATIDLENGNHPINKVLKEIAELTNKKIYLFITPFLPAPLIDIIIEKGYKVFTEQKSPTQFYSYIQMDS